jgi:hypothetical protein
MEKVAKMDMTEKFKKSKTSRRATFRGFLF